MITAESFDPVAYARRAGMAPVDQDMVIAAARELPRGFSCGDVADALPRDDRGRRRSEYLVALVLEQLCRRGILRVVCRRTDGARGYEARL